MAVTSTTTVESEATRDLAELTASAMGKSCEDVREHAKPLEEVATGTENGVEPISDRPPSPPSTGASTPTLSIAPCPSRLWPFVPPPQYGVVEDYTIFRSSYPLDRNMEFIKTLEIKSILTLVETDPTPGYVQWLEDAEVKQGKVTLAPNKEAKGAKAASVTSIDSLCEALLFTMDGSNHPLWIHCNQGRHRTGCVVACLRKIQGMPIEKAIAEYVAYASPKERPGDITLINSFDPNAVFTYAKQTEFIGGEDPKFKHAGPTPITNVYELAHELAKSGRQDSIAASGAVDPMENLSSTMSEVSLGEPSEPLADVSIRRISSSTSLSTQTGKVNDVIDPRLLEDGHYEPNYADMGVQIVEAEDDGMERVEGLALRGEIDPAMDHESVAAALA